MKRERRIATAIVTSLITVCSCGEAGRAAYQIGSTVHAPLSAPMTRLAPGWRLDTPLPEKRVDVASLRGTDGEIYAFGISSIVDAFDPSIHRWSARAPLPMAVGFAGRAAATAGSDGTIYALAGGAFQGYDPTTNRWTERAPMPIYRSDAAAVTGKDGKIYVLGGARSDPEDNSNRLYPRGIGVYDPSTNSWQIKAPMPTAREGLGAAVGADGTIYAIGGGTVHYDRFFKCYAAVEAYNPTTNRWSRRRPLPTPMCGTTAGSKPNGTIDVVGGSTLQGGEEGSKITPATGTILAFDSTGNRWTVLTRTPFPRKVAGAVVEPDGSVYVVGGADRFGKATATVQRFSPAG